MNAFKPLRTAKIRRLFTVLELEAQEQKPDIHAMEVAEREIALEIKAMIDEISKKAVEAKLTYR